MVGEKIRAYREFMGLSQVQLAELSGINVGTIRKYELGIRNPKPQQLEKIARAMHLNYSVFLDFNIETVGDVFSLLFAIDKAVDLSLSSTASDNGDSDTITLTFERSVLQETLAKWCKFKATYDAGKKAAFTIEDEEQRNQQVARLDALYEDWKLRVMGTTFDSNTIVTKETKGISVKVSSSSNFINTD